MSLICLYSHDGEGLGHLRRNTHIAEFACQKFPDASALLLTACPATSAFGIESHFDTVKIPTLMKDLGGVYHSALRGIATELIQDIRIQLLQSTLERTRPEVLIVDKHPGGLNNELLPALRWLKRYSPHTKTIFGMRDILDEPEATAREMYQQNSLSVLEEFYDLIWIYSDPHIFPTADFYKLPAAVKRKCHYCGYLVGEMPLLPAGAARGSYIVATVGGGRDGRPVLEAALRAVEELRNNYSETTLFLFAGPLMSRRDFAELRRITIPYRKWARIERFSPRIRRYLLGARAIITMGGYNTLLECVQSGRPTIVVPRQTPRSEQVIRANTFAGENLVRVVGCNELEGERLAEELDLLLSGRWCPTPFRDINLSGYEVILDDLREILGHTALKEACSA